MEENERENVLYEEERPGVQDAAAEKASCDEDACKEDTQPEGGEEETEAVPFRLTELCEPPKERIKSDVALYAVVAAGALVLVTMVSYVFIKLEWNILFAEALLVLLFIVITLTLYRKRLVSYRYTLTDRMLSVDRVVGKKVTPEVSVHLSSISYIKPFPEVPVTDRRNMEQFYHGKREEARGISYRMAGMMHTLLISMSEDFRAELVQKWKAAKK